MTATGAPPMTEREQLIEAMARASTGGKYGCWDDLSEWEKRGVRSDLSAALSALLERYRLHPIEREEGVQEMLSDYTPFINKRPPLLSLLYDIDMLPEQTVTRTGAIRLAGLCEVWRRGEAGELARPVQQEGGQ